MQLPDIKWLDAKQQDEVFEFIPPEDKLIFVFLRYTGCRPNEAAGMLRENVDKVKGQFTISTAMMKGGRVRPSTNTRISRPLPIIPEL